MEDWELNVARDAAVVQLLTNRCTIFRPGSGPDEYGGLDLDGDEVETDVPCRVHAETIIGRFASGLEGALPLFLVSLPYGANVQAQDVLEIDGNGSLTVMRVLEPETWGVVTKVEASPGVR